jgi:hypothetical protein
MNNPTKDLKKIIWMIYAEGFMQSSTFTVDKYLPKILALFSEECKDLDPVQELVDEAQEMGLYQLVGLATKLTEGVEVDLDAPLPVETTSQDGGWTDDLN